MLFNRRSPRKQQDKRRQLIIIIVSKALTLVKLNWSHFQITRFTSSFRAWKVHFQCDTLAKEGKVPFSPIPSGVETVSSANFDVHRTPHETESAVITMLKTL